ncbi:tripartite tricarboxylate transporter substrate binding protein [Paenisporosarcina indica]|uniref:tripartite tricarboxylate transporter substrate binding protein n=1 Tax=Paenisporosarcina indica TaxID=650093 RepID=UPI000A7E8A1B|nr:tripartite tricarboxylate transporter substrate binding protein [Paenisporosarcina indica]
MKRNLLISFLLVLSVLLAACGDADGATSQKENEKYPDKPITLIVPHPAGGGTDAVARSLANAAEKHLGQSISVVNKPGGGGSVGMTEGSMAKNDGLTATFVTVELTTLRHLGISELKYQDFEPVAQINFDPGAIAVPFDAPYDTIEEFFAYAKENPRKIKMGSTVPGAIWHLSAASIEKAAGVEFNHIPFDGAAPAVTALLGGHVDAVAASPAEILANVKAGKLKALLIVDTEKAATLPDVPTLTDIGLDIAKVGAWRGVTVPKGTPESYITKLEDAFLKAAKEEEFISFMETSGLGISVLNSEDFGKAMEDSDASFGKLIPTLNID